MRSTGAPLGPCFLVLACATANGTTSDAADAATEAMEDDAPGDLPPDAAPEPTPGQSRTDDHGVVQQWVPPGTFLMGSSDAQLAALRAMSPPGWVAGALGSEQPQHMVRLTRGFWLDRLEVSNGAFRAFVDDGGYDRSELWSAAGRSWLAGKDKTMLPHDCVGTASELPRVCITWYEADAYARWRGGRLPTEAEWEYAARGPSATIYPWGDDWDAARAHVEGATAPAAVGGLPAGASWIGALDMSGNAMEWVADWLDANYYSRSPVDDPQGPGTGRIKVERGGWWGGNLFVARAAYRHYEDPPSYQDHHIGFRVVTP